MKYFLLYNNINSEELQSRVHVYFIFYNTFLMLVAAFSLIIFCNYCLIIHWKYIWIYLVTVLSNLEINKNKSEDT